MTETPAIQRGGPLRSGGLRSCIIDLFAWIETRSNSLLPYTLALIRLGWASVNRDIPLLLKPCPTSVGVPVGEGSLQVQAL